MFAPACLTCITGGEQHAADNHGAELQLCFRSYCNHRARASVASATDRGVSSIHRITLEQFTMLALDLKLLQETGEMRITATAAGFENPSQDLFPTSDLHVTEQITVPHAVLCTCDLNTMWACESTRRSCSTQGASVHENGAPVQHKQQVCNCALQVDPSLASCYMPST